MGISEIFSAADVILDVAVGSKRELFEVLADEVARRSGRASQEIVDAIQAREQIGSTALGKGVALPHAEIQGSGPPTTLFVRLKRPVDFDAPDEEPVDLVFLVLWPAASGKGLLPTMSEICRALRDPQSLRLLRQAETPDEIVRLVHRLMVDGDTPGGTAEQT